MARKMPVINWIVKQRPRIEPKFHQIERLIGAGRSRRLCFSVLYRGIGVFRGFIIGLVML